MKYLKYTLVLLVFSSFNMMGQTDTENYIKSTTYQIETLDGIKKRIDQQTNLSNDHKIETITYFDGLGRPIQSISKQAGGNKQDIITPIVYDDFGRQVQEHLPYANTTPTTPTLNFRDHNSLMTDLENYYNTKFPNEWGSGDVINPYSEKIIEASPLNRVLEQGAPGRDWLADKNSDADHSIKFDYQSNISGEVVLFTVTFPTGDTGAPALSSNNHYAPNELYKTITKDENWDPTQTHLKDHTTEEFKDKQGRVVLKRTYDKNVAHDTYYVYDDFGNLTYVLPPKIDAQTTSIPTLITLLDDLGYQYKYDSRNRLIEKKIPGKGWEYIVYNKLDQPILTQDQNLKASNTWLFTKYDQFGRVAYTGIVSNGATRSILQSDANNTSLQYVTQSSSSSKIAGSDVFYTNNGNVYPTNGITVLHTINYYDTYTNLPKVFSGNTATTYKNITSTLDTKGLATVSQIKVLDTNHWITNVNYYDDRARIIYTYSNNPYLDTIDETQYDLDFTGKPREIKTTHTKASILGITTYDQFTYDHAGRLLTHKQEINGQTPELIVQNYYDELGNLYKKDVGGSTSLDEVPGTIQPDPTLPLIPSGYTDIVGLSHNTITGVITKTAGNGYNGGLATNGTLDSDGYLEFEMLQDNLYVTVGLAYSNTDNHYASIDFALDYNAFAGAYVYELGVSKASNGGYVEYVPGDVFKIERIGDKIHYKKNDVTFYISTTTSTGVLLGDIAMYSDQSKIKNLKIDRSVPAPPGKYTDIFGLDYNDTTGVITKTIGNGWNGGLATSNEISGDGYLEYEVLQDNMYLVLGLATSNPDNNYTSIDFAIDHNGTAGAYVYELGVDKSSQGGYTTYVTGDKFKVERVGSTIYYKKNGSTFYTSTVSSTKELLGDVAMYSDQSKIKDLKLVDANTLLRVNNNTLANNSISTSLQTVNYKYNIRGWLTHINQDIFFDNDLFNFTLSYNNPTGVATELYNGNISQTSWNTLNIDSSTKTYTYGYDALNRITSGIDNTGRYNLTSVNYDKNGNITDLVRQGHIVSNPNQNTASDFGVMDNLTYIYDSGNQLQRVTDSGNAGYGFINGTNTNDDYAYDANGNMTKDLNKSIPQIDYNYLNLPTWLYRSQGAGNTGAISYVYDALGNKQSKQVVGNNGITITQYAGNYIYKNDELQFFNHSEGYIEVDDISKEFEYVYQYKDHLGNVRLSYKDNDASNSIDASTEILEENNYYPFGLEHQGYNTLVTSTNIAQDYRFQGQELEEALDYDMYEFDLRHYDASIGRFVTTDPYEQFMSPYIAMGNNPITSFDPDGGQCYDANGNQIACPDDDIYDEYRDNPNNRIDIMPEVVVVAPSGEDEVDPNLMNGDKGKEYLRNREINEAVFKENMNGVMLTAGVIVTSGRGNPISRGAAISYGVLGTLVSGAILEVSNFANDMNVITSPTFLEATDSSKNERHGDGQGLTESEEKLIEQLEGQMQGAAKKVKEKIKKKIRNIRENAQRRSKGEEHSRTKKGN